MKRREKRTTESDIVYPFTLRLAADAVMLPKSSSSSLHVQSFDVIPSAEEFASQIESKNVPAVFRGCVKFWKAFSLWNPLDGGLDYLQETVGSSNVEAMLSHSAPVFYGDIRNHERVSLPFSTFIEYCKGVLQNVHCCEDNILEPKEQSGAEHQAEQFDSPQQIYLAQVPLLSRDSAEKVQLESLREDIDVPSFLERKTLQSINLWMNSSQTRSSTHYDPHHNLLCTVSGCKRVVLWPPSATPFLYPLPIYGESSNHSAIPLEKPDFSLYPRSECSLEHSQDVTLQAGDAIFIPEGWYHQVDSDRLTAAVNFWWQSDVISGLVEHMDSYYLRRILKRLTDKEMNRMLHLQPFPISLTEASRNAEQVNENGGKKSKPRIMLHELDPTTAQALHDLVALVHKHVNPTQSVGDLPDTRLSVGDKDDLNKRLEVNLFTLRDDRIATILWTLRPHAVQSLFLAMAHNFPRTLEALVLHALSPVGAEVLTQKFEEMDQLIGQEERNQFYENFYGIFDDQSAAMQVLLGGKESFARQAFKNVLDQYLAVKDNMSDPTMMEPDEEQKR